MALEIERKFLITDSSWKSTSDQGIFIKQGYLVSEVDKVVRIRVHGEKGILTIKGSTVGMTRTEYEYEIPLADAFELLALCGDNVIEKTRYGIDFAGNTWEIDVFQGRNKGLEVAEVELVSEDQKVDLPTWVGKEVTHDPRYYNACLIDAPFDTWD